MFSDHWCDLGSVLFKSHCVGDDVLYHEVRGQKGLLREGLGVTVITAE
jgi:hypothetical protein